MADQEVAGWLRELGGAPLEAVAPAEEAVQHYPELTAASPAYLPDLATSLNNLRSSAANRDDGTTPWPRSPKPSGSAGTRPRPAPPTCPTSPWR